MKVFNKLILVTIGCLISAPTSGIGGSILWDISVKKIGGNKIQRRFIKVKVDFYDLVPINF